MALAATIRLYLERASRLYTPRRIPPREPVRHHRQLFFFLIHAQAYLAFFGHRASVAGWRARDAVLYFATSESLLTVLGAFPAWGHDLCSESAVVR